MTYPKLTVFNFRVSYFLFRVFTLFWLCQQLDFFYKFSKRATELYEPTVWFQRIIMPVFPAAYLYYSAAFVMAVFIVFSLFRFSILVNSLLFFLAAYISLPVVSYNGLSHTNHILILSYFFSIFLNPKKLADEDYKYVQIYYLGLLITYSLAGFWKLVSAGKDLITANPETSWFETNAAKFNSMLNYAIVDQELPHWMLKIYEYENLWIVITIVGIVLQALCFLGAFSRKYLTFCLVFLLMFHFYTVYFVIADLRIMKYGLIVLFFPYHYFYPWIRKIF
ncbi:hypothetical protein QGN23_14735 [Chryseobacterium gotjawalense]|uniref:HTTM domain-containing protein n=1 Tax=Chryseobacterium gotjawalense TaxID=3042315 RepID=A0ABY8RDR3_9FLAO|nr:hypothetical protein [Chryseobacterium sp. wdc7]WHF51659.1 hypothetical protein QGN23_14735 [Chryseobacterium sp. wdc7]